MKYLFSIICFIILTNAYVAADYASRAEELLNAGKIYSRGCSGFVAEVLNIPWENANSLMGDTPQYVGKNGQYTGLNRGDVVGWKNGHVAIFTGNGFIDVPGLGKQPRRVSSYGPQELYKSSKY